VHGGILSEHEGRYEAAGLECMLAELRQVELAGETRYAVCIHASAYGTDIFETIVAVKSGNLIAFVAGMSHPEDHTKEILTYFRPVD